MAKIKRRVWKLNSAGHWVCDSIPGYVYKSKDNTWWYRNDPDMRPMLYGGGFKRPEYAQDAAIAIHTKR